MTVETRVNQHELSINAQDSVLEILDSLREAEAPALARRTGHHGNTTLYVTDALTRIGSADLAPHNPDGPDVLEPADQPRQLEQLGYLTLHDLIDDTSTGSYLDEGRRLTAIRVLRPFHCVEVHYRWRHALIGPADEWTILARSGVIWPGLYVHGVVGDFATRDVGLVYAGPVDLDTDAMIYGILEEFSVHRCHARCDRCGADWYADSGDWTFHAHRAHGDFDYATARRHHQNTVMCPEPLCLSGRVSFTVG